MKLLSRLRELLIGWNTPIDHWLVVDFDEAKITISAKPRWREGWEYAFAWDSIIKICFKGEGGVASDLLYVPESVPSARFRLPSI